MTDVRPAVADGADVLTLGGPLTGGMAAVGVGGLTRGAGLALLGAGLEPPVAGGFAGVDTARSDELSGGGTGGTEVPDGF